MPRHGLRTDSSTDEGDTELVMHTELVMRMIEVMSDGRVLQELKKQLYPTALYDKLDTLTSKLEGIAEQLKAKDDIISKLETTVNHLEQQLDAHEQYSRRANLRIQGIPEDGRGEDVESKVLTVVNKAMSLNPPLKSTDLERSHRLGRVVSGQDRPRAVIVRFVSERVRDSVYRARTSLKGHNDGKRQQDRLFINEDLTAKRATIAFKARDLKKQKKILDCWTHSGRILVKDNNNAIHEISSDISLNRFTSA